MQDHTPSTEVRPNFILVAPKREAERAFQQKEQREAGANAMSEYEAEGLAVRAKTVRLRTLRLDQEAREEIKKTAAKSRGRPPGEKASTEAGRMASEQIDRLADQSATPDERATRKRRLLNGPKEFRNMRTDHPS